MNALWWGNGGATNQGMRWISWDKLSIQKIHGGMSFKGLASVNAAMFGKQEWKI